MDNEDMRSSDSSYIAGRTHELVHSERTAAVKEQVSTAGATHREAGTIGSESSEVIAQSITFVR